MMFFSHTTKMPVEARWDSLLRKCLRKETQAQQFFYRLYASRLYPILKRMLADEPMAEEALQDCFLKIFDHLVEFEDEEHLLAWMRRIARHTAIDYLRREPFEWEPLDEDLSVSDEEEESTDEEIIHHRVEEVKEALLRLPTGYRTVLSLYLFEGYDMEEIAEVLGVRSASVRSQYLRGKMRLLESISGVAVKKKQQEQGHKAKK